MSIKEEDGGTKLSREEIEDLLRETGSASDERDARVDEILSKVEENEEKIAANREKIEQEGLTIEMAARAVAHSTTTQGNFYEEGTEDRQPVEDLFERTSAVEEDTELVENDAIESEQVTQNIASPEFQNFVGGSTLIAFSLLALFIILGTQDVIAGGVAAVLVGTLSVFSLGFGKTWYDLGKS